MRFLFKFLLIAAALIATIKSNAQLAFSPARISLHEESYCMALARQDNRDGDVREALRRFNEEPLDVDPGRHAFRVVTYGERADAKDMTIRTIERRDSLCIVTVKYMRNGHKDQIFAHTKTYRLEKWLEFERLAKKYLGQSQTSAGLKIAYVDGCFQLYEYHASGVYRCLTGADAGAGAVFLHDYLEYLLSPIFEERCE